MIYILLYLLIGLVLLGGSTFIFYITVIKNNKNMDDDTLLNEVMSNSSHTALLSVAVICYILWPLSFPIVIRGYYKAYKDIKNRK